MRFRPTGVGHSGSLRLCNFFSTALRSGTPDSFLLCSEASHLFRPLQFPTLAHQKIGQLRANSGSLPTENDSDFSRLKITMRGRWWMGCWSKPEAKWRYVTDWLQLDVLVLGRQGGDG